MARKTFLMLLLAGAVVLPCPAPAGQLLFEKELDSDIKFYQVLDNGLIVVGTEQMVYALDPQTGAEKWKIEKLATEWMMGRAMNLPGSPYLVYQHREPRDMGKAMTVGSAAGVLAESAIPIPFLDSVPFVGKFVRKQAAKTLTKEVEGEKNPPTRCLDIATGEQVWEEKLSPVAADTSGLTKNQEMALKGADMAADKLIGVKGLDKLGKLGKKDELPLEYANIYTPVIDEGRQQFLISVVGYFKKGEKFVTRVGVVGVDLETGKVNFIYTLQQKKASEEKIISGSLWVGPPQIIGDLVLVDWAGVHTFKAADGTPVASVVIDRTFKGAKANAAIPGMNAPAVAEGQTAYVAAGERLVAVDLQTSAIKWEHKDLKTTLPEMHLVGDKLVVRTGGTFTYTPSKKIWPIFIPVYGWFIHAPYLLLTRNKVKTKEFPYGVVVFDKNTGQLLADTGKMDKKAKLTALSPLLIEGNTAYFGTRSALHAIDLDKLSYKFTTPFDSDPEDVPRELVLDQGKLYLLLSQTTAAFDPADGKLLWSHTVPGLKLDLATRFSMAAQQPSARYALAQSAFSARNFNKRVEENSRLMEARLGSARQYGLYNYCLTGKPDQPEVVGVSLKTGKPDRHIKLDGKGTEYRVDPFTGILVHASAKDAKKLRVFDSRGGE